MRVKGRTPEISSYKGGLAVLTAYFPSPRIHVRLQAVDVRSFRQFDDNLRLPLYVPPDRRLNGGSLWRNHITAASDGLGKHSLPACAAKSLFQFERFIAS